MEKLTAEQLAEACSDYANSFSREKGKEFAEAMSTQHRTLQQSFTRMCLEWLEHCASDEYRHDGRNEASHKVAKILMEGYAKAQAADFPGDSEFAKPSRWLPFV